MTPRNDKDPRRDVLGDALVALAEVALVSLALGFAVGTGPTALAWVLAGTLVGVVVSRLVGLMHDARGEKTAEAARDKGDEPPAVARLRPTATASLPDEPSHPRQQHASPDAVPSMEQAPSLGPSAPRASSASTLDLEALSERLTSTNDPLGELKLFVGDIRTREARGEGSASYPSPFERFAARMIVEAGLFASDVKLPRVRLVRPPASDMFYLRIEERSISYLAKVRILSIEAALNALRFSSLYFDDPDERSVVEHYQLVQRLRHSVTSQSPNLPECVPIIEDEDPDGEWAVRLGISTAIESFQLPHRLAARWRVNVADGNVGIEIELTPADVFPHSAYVSRLGLVPSTREMRRKAASDYALRLALLVAVSAFRTSERILHVWVAGIAQTAHRTACYLSVDFDRGRFSRLDLSELDDFSELYRTFAATMRLEDGILRPVEQTFSLDEPRFCPPRRFEALGFSTRKIEPRMAQALGAERVSGLAIDEGEKREALASYIAAGASDTTEGNVRMILELAGDDPDPSIRSAAERTVGKLIAGSIEMDGQAIAEEFLEGDPLSRAVMRAHELLSQRKPEEAERVLAPVLDAVDRTDIYRDSGLLEHRFFANYVERALYNRLFALKGSSPLLVPQAYYDAHLLVSIAQAMQGKGEEALAHARRLVELSPLDARSYVHLSHCLERTGRDDEAVDVLNHLLGIAHDPEGIALAYYRMAFFQWRQGHALAAQACYAFALRFMPAFAPIIAMELSTLAIQNPGSFHEGMDVDGAEQALRDQGIIVAPTSEMSEATLACARASLNAEIFPVARNFAWIVGMMSGDDILFGLLRSIEEGPKT